MTPLQKLVDGHLVDMSPAEEAALRAEWTANGAAMDAAIAAAPATPPLTLLQRVAALEATARAKGWAV